MASLIDTNVLVYRYDPRFPDKQKIASDLLRKGLMSESIRIPHQALLEFVAVVTRVPLTTSTSTGRDRSLLSAEHARREVEEFLATFPVLYPDASLLRTALRGASAYRLSWYDAHLWAYAEHYGMDELISEDFQHERLYGNVRIRNPFLE